MLRAWSPIWGWYKKEGMVRDGIQKSWEAEENAVWENASHWSGEMTEQVNTAMLKVFLPWKLHTCPRRHFLALRKWLLVHRLLLWIIITMSTGNRYKQLLYFFLLSFCYQYQLNLQYNLRESFISLQDDIVNLCKIT